MSWYRPIRFLFTISAVVLLANIVFFALHYLSLSVPQELVKERVAEAFKNYNMVHEHYPSRRWGYSSNFATLGLDHYTDCVVVGMAMYREPDRWRNTVVPRVAQSGKSTGSLCEDVDLIARGERPISPASSWDYVRLWFGAKVFVSLAFRYLDMFQIQWLIRTLAYLGYCFLGMLIYSARRELLPATIPIVIFGIAFSGLNYHGGISNALPHVVALYGLCGLLVLDRWRPSTWTVLTYFALCGVALSFVFFMDGSEILFVSMSIFLLYFVVYHDHDRATRYRMTIVMLAGFTAAFVGSFVLKQFITAFYEGTDVFRVFWNALAYRITGDLRGVPISVADSLEKQFGYYYFATFNWRSLADWVMGASLVAWLGALMLTLYRYFGRRDAEVLHSFLVIAAAGAIALLRFTILKNHSYIHIILIGRYLSWFLVYGWVALAIAYLFYRAARNEIGNRGFAGIMAAIPLVLVAALYGGFRAEDPVQVLPDSVQIYWRGAGVTWGEESSRKITVTADGKMHETSIALAAPVTMEQFRVDPTEFSGMNVEIDEIRLIGADGSKLKYGFDPGDAPWYLHGGREISRTAGLWRTESTSEDLYMIGPTFAPREITKVIVRMRARMPKTMLRWMLFS